MPEHVHPLRAPVTVVYDPKAVLDLEEIKGRDDRKAIFNAVDKLRRLGTPGSPTSTRRSSSPPSERGSTSGELDIKR